MAFSTRRWGVASTDKTPRDWNKIMNAKAANPDPAAAVGDEREGPKVQRTVEGLPPLVNVWEGQHDADCPCFKPSHRELEARVEQLTRELREAPIWPEGPEPHDGEHCQVCGRSYAATVYHVPDEVWVRISPKGNEGGLLCPPHAAQRAVEAGIDLWWEAAEHEFPSKVVEAEVGKLREAAYSLWLSDRQSAGDDLYPDIRTDRAFFDEILDAALAEKEQGE
jgi:hypothetical protein